MNTSTEPRFTAMVLGAPIDVLNWTQTLDTIDTWARRKESRYVCICNAHSVVTATQDPAFGAVIRGADMATPDGAPVAWMLRRLGNLDQERINGPDLMERYCERAAAQGMSVALFGSTQATLGRLQTKMKERWPQLQLVAAISPPFRAPSASEDQAYVAELNRSGAGVIFVSLGCPKQEVWMAEHRGRVTGVMIGVGAAFDFHAGTVSRAPDWMRSTGLEWLHRLASEPRRLWRRYLITNSAFVLGAIGQLLLAKGKANRTTR